MLELSDLARRLLERALHVEPGIGGAECRNLRAGAVVGELLAHGLDLDQDGHALLQHLDRLAARRDLRLYLGGTLVVDLKLRLILRGTVVRESKLDLFVLCPVRRKAIFLAGKVRPLARDLRLEAAVPLCLSTQLCSQKRAVRSPRGVPP